MAIPNYVTIVDFRFGFPGDYTVKNNKVYCLTEETGTEVPIVQPNNIYNRFPDEFKLPPDYEFSGEYRPVTMGEYFISVYNDTYEKLIPKLCIINDGLSTSRFIVKKKDIMTITFTIDNKKNHCDVDGLYKGLLESKDPSDISSWIYNHCSCGAILSAEVVKSV